MGDCFTHSSKMALSNPILSSWTHFCNKPVQVSSCAKAERCASVGFFIDTSSGARRTAAGHIVACLNDRDEKGHGQEMRTISNSGSEENQDLSIASRFRLGHSDGGTDSTLGVSKTIDGPLCDSKTMPNGLGGLENMKTNRGGSHELFDSDGEEEGNARLRKLAEEMFLVRSSSQFDVDYLGESTKGDLNVRRSFKDQIDNEGIFNLDGTTEELIKAGLKRPELLLEGLQIPPHYPHGAAERGVFCSRTLSLRSISTIGYDMDYTLIHYNVNAWEGRAYEYGMDNLRSMGYAVDGLCFDPDLVIRGLIMDKENGNIVKADRFGYVKRAMHGTKMLSNTAISRLYGRELVDLRNESRWEFLNTLFSISEAVMYMQMVERFDEGVLSSNHAPLTYNGLYKVVAKALFKAHVEGQLKNEIINEPERFVELDPELPLALLDQKEAGKRLILITNSDYHYTNKMMQHAFNRYLPDGMDWRALFEMVIVSARKPEFFKMSHPLYEVVTEDGLMRPCFTAKPGGLYCGGSAQMVEMALGVRGGETLYVGDHIYTDVSQSKVHLSWRTALICRELEREVRALALGREHKKKLIELMNQKEVVGGVFNQLRLTLQRRTMNRAAQTPLMTEMDEKDLAVSIEKLLYIMQRLDKEIARMLEADGSHFNEKWGYLSRAGLWDKSHLTRQIEKYADIYTSRVSNFLQLTPFMYFRSQAQSLAHDLHPY